MNKNVFRLLLVAIIFCIGAGCANITAPTGGRRDKTPPKLKLATPSDSLRNTRAKRIELNFDEYITLTDAFKEVQISPTLDIQPVVTSNNKKVIIKIADTLLENNTTYRVSLGTAVRDLHEGNIFANYTYTFSTGSYFDSLQLTGRVINAATGDADTGGISVLLYYATANDSAVVRHKPKYITQTKRGGIFTFKGLPKKEFRIYALQDANANLIYDGGATEMIAFNDKSLTPGDSAQEPVTLRLFSEIVDTSVKKSGDTLSSVNRKERMSPLAGDRDKRNSAKNIAKEGFAYTVNADTANAAKRTFDILDSMHIVFTRVPTINKARITLTYDSAGVTYTPDYTIKIDTVHPLAVHISTEWHDNTVYTLKLAKGFAKDTSGADANPSKYVFRTKQDEDYGKIRVHLPARYIDAQYILVACTEKDTVYKKPVSDTVVSLAHLRPGKYNFRIIVDKNRNGKWDTGDLFAKVQPEEVIPYPETLPPLKPGWENDIDFDKKPVEKKDRMDKNKH